MIAAKTQYKTYDGELLAIVEVFKTWHYYLKNCKYKVFVLTDHNNLHQFMDIKNFSSCQVWWAKELFRYYFQINYCQGKANTAANVLSHYSQRNPAEEEDFKAENTQMFYCLQFLLTNTNLLGLTLSNLSFSSSLLPLHQIFVWGTYVLPQLLQF